MYPCTGIYYYGDLAKLLSLEPVELHGGKFFRYEWVEGHRAGEEALVAPMQCGEYAAASSYLPEVEIEESTDTKQEELF